MKIVHVAGARPNFVKIASIMHACDRQDAIQSVLVHTGQHYSENMSRMFFDELDIPKPDINLEVGSGSHACQTAEIMKRFEAVLLEEKPDLVLVVGDVNSTVACALDAIKLGIKCIHVEAGLRSFDRSMPEEINRIVTDSICDMLFVTEQSGIDNLDREGISGPKVHFVGNVMIDTLLANRAKAEESTILDNLALVSQQYAVVTLHRPSNVDVYTVFSGVIDALEAIQQDQPIVFPIHPRTVKNLEDNGLMVRLKKLTGMKLIEPLGYLDFLKLMSNAKIVLTDSGGMQEETTILGVPCLTLRDNTERPVTVDVGTNQLVGSEPDAILRGYQKAINGKSLTRIPPLWDGRASHRIVEILLSCTESIVV